MNRLAAHVESLATEHQITIEAGEEAAAFKRERRITLLHPVTNLATYYTALHELGHVIHPRGSGRGLRLEQEYYAWAWALDNAIRAPSGKVKRHMSEALLTHVRYAESNVLSMRLPGDHHPFWSLIEASAFETWRAERLARLGRGVWHPERKAA